MLGLMSLLLPVAIIGGIVYSVVRFTRARTPQPTAPGDEGAVRRLFVYTMLFVALMVAATGLQGLIGRVLDSASRSDTELATTLALTLVGLPVYVALARWTWRRLNEHPGERHALGWTLYLTGSMTVSLATTSATSIGLFAQLVAGDGFDGRLMAMILVWATVWTLHWVAWRRVPPATAGALPLYLGSALGLGLAAAGFGTTLSLVATRWFDAAEDTAVSGVDGADVATAAFVGVVGLAVWVWHWLVHAVKLDRTPMWLAYLMLYGVLGGLAASLIGAGRTLFLVLEWLFGNPETTSALAHFRDLSPAGALMIIGLVVWQYHGSVIGPAEGRPRTDVDRTYDAVVAGVSLAAVAAALSILVVALFRLADPAAASDATSGGDVLLGAITLLVIGGPLWAVTWRRMQHHTRRGPEEAASTPRRTFLFSVLGVSGVVAFGALIAFLIVVFETWFDERSGSLSTALEWPVALLITSGAIAAYHFVIARAERESRVSIPRRDVLLVWSGNGEASEIASLTHTDVRMLRRTDQAPGPADVAAIARAIEKAPGTHLLVIAGEDDVTVVPYE